MKIRLIWAGKTKEQFVSEGIRKYVKLIKPFAETVITELKEEKEKNLQNMVRREGDRILDLKVPYILLDEK